MGMKRQNNVMQILAAAIRMEGGMRCNLATAEIRTEAIPIAKTLAHVLQKNTFENKTLYPTSHNAFKAIMHAIRKTAIGK
jgi:hypothetical protein